MTLATTGNVLVLEVDLVVEERHDERRSSTSSTTLLSLVTAHRVVGVEGTLSILVDTAQDGVDIVREEALVVEDVTQTLGAGGNSHGLVVAVTVHFDDGVELLGEGVAVGGKSDYGQNDTSAFLVVAFAADAEEFGGVAGVDVVA